MPMMEIRTEIHWTGFVSEVGKTIHSVSSRFFPAPFLSRIVLTDVYYDTQFFTQQPGRRPDTREPT